MSLALVNGGEDTSGLDDVLSARLAPWNLGGVLLGEHADLLAVDVEETVGVVDVALESTVSRVVLEHVHHVVEWDERVVDGNHLNSLLQSGSEHNTTDTAESVDTNASRHFLVFGFLLFVKK